MRPLRVVSTVTDATAKASVVFVSRALSVVLIVEDSPRTLACRFLVGVIYTRLMGFGCGGLASPVLRPPF